MPKIRLYIEQNLALHDQISLDPQQSHYLVTVMRQKIGDEIIVFNGLDGEWVAQISETSKRQVYIIVVSQKRHQSIFPDIWLIFSLIKRNRMDFMVEKATELGVGTLIPVMTERTNYENFRSERLESIIREASEQSERLDVPKLETPLSLKQLLQKWPSERTLLHMDETGGGQPISQLLLGLNQGPVAILIGPEGGFSQEEIRHIEALEMSRKVGLGPRILRADTAALAALSCYQASLGDWHTMPKFEF